MKINEKGNKLMTDVIYHIKDKLWLDNCEFACNYVAKLS